MIDSDISVMQFFEKHQPLPNDDDLTQELVDDFDQAREYLCNHPIPEVLPNLLRVFGIGDGWGTYQLVDEVLQKYPHNQVVPLLKQNIKSKHVGIRGWNLEFCAIFPDESLIDDLSPVLFWDDEDCVCSAIIALGQIKSKRSRDALLRGKATLTREPMVSLLSQYT